MNSNRNDYRDAREDCMGELNRAQKWIAYEVQDNIKGGTRRELKRDPRSNGVGGMFGASSAKNHQKRSIVRGVTAISFRK